MRELTPAASEKDEGEILSLVSRAKQKDKEAFTELVLHYRALVFSLIQKIISLPEDVDDIYQDTWVRAWRSIDKLEDPKRFQQWLCKIATNRARDRYRDRRHQSFVFLPDASVEEYDMVLEVKLSVPGPEQQAIRQDCMREAFSHLSPQTQVCIQLADQWNFRLEEIADILCISKGTVSSYLSRGRQRFCQVYQRLAGGPSVQRKEEKGGSDQ